MHYLNVQV